MLPNYARISNTRGGASPYAARMELRQLRYFLTVAEEVLRGDPAEGPPK